MRSYRLLNVLTWSSVDLLGCSEENKASLLRQWDLILYLNIRLIYYTTNYLGINCYLATVHFSDSILLLASKFWFLCSTNTCFRTCGCIQLFRLISLLLDIHCFGPQFSISFYHFISLLLPNFQGSTIILYSIWWFQFVSADWTKVNWNEVRCFQES